MTTRLLRGVGMTIRAATADDIPAVVAMGLLQLSEIYPSLRRNPDRLTDTLTRLIAAESVVALVADDGTSVMGMIGMIEFPHHLTGDRTAGEVFWFVAPEARGSLGIRLLKAAEEWAIQRGVTCIQMSAPAGSTVETIYNRCGYERLETTYRKVHAAND